MFVLFIIQKKEKEQIFIWKAFHSVRFPEHIYMRTPTLIHTSIPNICRQICKPSNILVFHILHLKFNVFDIQIKCQNNHFIKTLNITYIHLLLTGFDDRMSFQYDGIEVTKLKSLWPNIASKLSPELTVKLKEHLESMSTFVQICCEIRPENFSEYTAFVMLSTIFELIESPSILFRLRKSQFTAHTFSTNTGRWCHDRDKVNKKSWLCVSK